MNKYQKITQKLRLSSQNWELIICTSLFFTLCSLGLNAQVFIKDNASIYLTDSSFISTDSIINIDKKEKLLPGKHIDRNPKIYIVKGTLVSNLVSSTHTPIIIIEKQPENRRNPKQQKNTYNEPRETKRPNIKKPEVFIAIRSSFENDFSFRNRENFIAIICSNTYPLKQDLSGVPASKMAFTCFNNYRKSPKAVRYLNYSSYSLFPSSFKSRPPPPSLS
ncbi:hypothetical protein ABXT08_13760 [Chryseobacterium sp. NRRL B-14859]|uniref:hypothetical protein n=1 Tax=Chryseobacterium sp. NRRL B-14859 TaxID=1562763 RepID=UPI003398A75D